MIYRQGDILIRKIKSAPKGKREPLKDGILAHGEVTGHCHRIAELTKAELFDCGAGRFVSVGRDGVSIVHDEHDPIVLTPGNYEVIRQREYSPEEIRQVAD
jgi:hypothetical protein